MDLKIKKKAEQEYIKQHGESPKLINEANLERYGNANLSAAKAFNDSVNCDIAQWIPSNENGEKTQITIGLAPVIKIPHVALEGSELNLFADVIKSSDTVSFVAKNDTSEMYISYEVNNIFSKEGSN